MAELDISANSIQLDCSVDSGICVEGVTKDLKKKLQEFKRILFILERDKEAMRLLRERLSRIAERKIVKKKKDGQSVCNVCFTQIDTDDSKTCIACYSCAKNVCRGEKCSEWVPRDGEWRCQLCAVRRDSYGKASSWVQEQYAVKRASVTELCHPMRARSEIYIPLCDPNESAFLCNFESVSEVPSPINPNQKQHIREYIEEVLADMIGGSLENATVEPMSTNNMDYQQVRNGQELQGISNVRLRRLIESIIAETIRQPPFASAGLITTTAIDSNDVDHRETSLPLNGNHCNGNGGQYFESKKYHDLLATAVLNKIVSTHGNGRHSESSPDLTSSSVFDNNHNALNLNKTDESVSSSSSVEPRSESSLTDPIRSINKDDDLSPNYGNFYDDNANDTIEADRESVLSDFISSHMVPLPHISAEPASEEDEDEEDFISVTSSRDANWEDNWLFKKKKSNKTSASVGMLVPAPKEDIRALIGDKPTDEVSDLSEIGSDTDDSSLEMVSASLEPLNDRLVNKHLIGGKNTKTVLDELVDRTSMISTSSLPDNVPPYTETKNEFVVSNDGLDESESLKISVNNCNKAVSNEAINANVTKSIPTKAEKLAKESQVTEDETIVPPPNDFTDDEKMRNLLAKFNEEQNNKTDSGDDNSSSLSPRSSISCALSAGIDRAEMDAYEGITDFCVEDEEGLASEIDPAESSSRRPSVIEILAAIALGPMLAVSASDDRNILTELELSSLMELNELAMAQLNAKGTEERRLGVIAEESLEFGPGDDPKIETIESCEETDLLSSPKMVMDAIRELVGKDAIRLERNEESSITIEEITEESTETAELNESNLQKTPNDPDQLKKDCVDSAESEKDDIELENTEEKQTTTGMVQKFKEEILPNDPADTIKIDEQKNLEQAEIEDTFEIVSGVEETKAETREEDQPEKCTIKNDLDKHTIEESKILEEVIDESQICEIKPARDLISSDEDNGISMNSISDDLGFEKIIPEDTSSISDESLHTIGSSSEYSEDLEGDATSFFIDEQNIAVAAELSEDQKLVQSKEDIPGTQPIIETESTNQKDKTVNEFILPPPNAFCDEQLKRDEKKDAVQLTEAHINSEIVQADTQITSENSNNEPEKTVTEVETHKENVCSDIKNEPEVKEDTETEETTASKGVLSHSGKSEEPPDKQSIDDILPKTVIESSLECVSSTKAPQNESLPNSVTEADNMKEDVNPKDDEDHQDEAIKKAEDSPHKKVEQESENIVEKQIAHSTVNEPAALKILSEAQITLQDLSSERSVEEKPPTSNPIEEQNSVSDYPQDVTQTETNSTTNSENPQEPIQKLTNESSSPKNTGAMDDDTVKNEPEAIPISELISSEKKCSEPCQETKTEKIEINKVNKDSESTTKAEEEVEDQNIPDNCPVEEKVTKSEEGLVKNDAAQANESLVEQSNDLKKVDISSGELITEAQPHLQLIDKLNEDSSKEESTAEKTQSEVQMTENLLDKTNEIDMQEDQTKSQIEVPMTENLLNESQTKSIEDTQIDESKLKTPGSNDIAIIEQLSENPQTETVEEVTEGTSDKLNSLEVDSEPHTEGLKNDGKNETISIKKEVEALNKDSPVGENLVPVESSPPALTEADTTANDETSIEEQNTKIKGEQKTIEGIDVNEINAIPKTDSLTSNQTSSNNDELTSVLPELSQEVQTEEISHANPIPIKECAKDEKGVEAVVEEDTKVLNCETLPSKQILKITDTDKLLPVVVGNDKTEDKECAFIPQINSEQSSEVLEIEKKENCEETPIQIESSTSEEPKTADIASVEPIFETHVDETKDQNQDHLDSGTVKTAENQEIKVPIDNTLTTTIVENIDSDVQVINTEVAEIIQPKSIPVDHDVVVASNEEKSEVNIVQNTETQKTEDAVQISKNESKASKETTEDQALLSNEDEKTSVVEKTIELVPKEESNGVKAETSTEHIIETLDKTEVVTKQTKEASEIEKFQAEPLNDLVKEPKVAPTVEACIFQKEENNLEESLTQNEDAEDLRTEESDEIPNTPMEEIKTECSLTQSESTEIKQEDEEDSNTHTDTHTNAGTNQSEDVSDITSMKTKCETSSVEQEPSVDILEEQKLQNSQISDNETENDKQAEIEKSKLVEVENKIDFKKDSDEEKFGYTIQGNPSVDDQVTESLNEAIRMADKAENDGDKSKFVDKNVETQEKEENTKLIEEITELSTESSITKESTSVNDLKNEEKTESVLITCTDNEEKSQEHINTPKEEPSNEPSETPKIEEEQSEKDQKVLTETEVGEVEKSLGVHEKVSEIRNLHNKSSEKINESITSEAVQVEVISIVSETSREIQEKLLPDKPADENEGSKLNKDPSSTTQIESGKDVLLEEKVKSSEELSSHCEEKLTQQIIEVEVFKKHNVKADEVVIESVTDTEPISTEDVNQNIELDAKERTESSAARDDKVLSQETNTEQIQDEITKQTSEEEALMSNETNTSEASKLCKDPVNESSYQNEEAISQLDKPSFENTSSTTAENIVQNPKTEECEILSKNETVLAEEADKTSPVESKVEVIEKEQLCNSTQPEKGIESSNQQISAATQQDEISEIPISQTEDTKEDTSTTDVVSNGTVIEVQKDDPEPKEQITEPSIEDLPAQSTTSEDKFKPDTTEVESEIEKSETTEITSEAVETTEEETSTKITCEEPGIEEKCETQKTEERHEDTIKESKEIEATPKIENIEQTLVPDEPHDTEDTSEVQVIQKIPQNVSEETQSANETPAEIDQKIEITPENQVEHSVSTEIINEQVSEATVEINTLTSAEIQSTNIESAIEEVTKEQEEIKLSEEVPKIEVATEIVVAKQLIKELSSSLGSKGFPVQEEILTSSEKVTEEEKSSEAITNPQEASKATQKLEEKEIKEIQLEENLDSATSLIQPTDSTESSLQIEVVSKLDEKISELTSSTEQIEEKVKEDITIDETKTIEEKIELPKPKETISIVTNTIPSEGEEGVIEKSSKEDILDNLAPKPDTESIKDAPILKPEVQTSEKDIKLEAQEAILDDNGLTVKTDDEKMKSILNVSESTLKTDDEKIEENDVTKNSIEELMIQEQKPSVSSNTQESVIDSQTTSTSTEAVQVSETEHMNDTVSSEATQKDISSELETTISNKSAYLTENIEDTAVEANDAGSEETPTDERSKTENIKAVKESEDVTALPEDILPTENYIEAEITQTEGGAEASKPEESYAISEVTRLILEKIQLEETVEIKPVLDVVTGVSSAATTEPIPQKALAEEEAISLQKFDDLQSAEIAEASKELPILKKLEDNQNETAVENSAKKEDNSCSEIHAEISQSQENTFERKPIPLEKLCESEITSAQEMDEAISSHESSPSPDTTPTTEGDVTTEEASMNPTSESEEPKLQDALIAKEPPLSDEKTTVSEELVSGTENLPEKPDLEKELTVEEQQKPQPKDLKEIADPTEQKEDNAIPGTIQPNEVEDELKSQVTSSEDITISNEVVPSTEISEGSKIQEVDTNIEALADIVGTNKITILEAIISEQENTNSLNLQEVSTEDENVVKDDVVMNEMSTTKAESFSKPNEPSISNEYGSDLKEIHGQKTESDSVSAEKEANAELHTVQESEIKEEEKSVETVLDTAIKENNKPLDQTFVRESTTSEDIREETNLMEQTAAETSVIKENLPVQEQLTEVKDEPEQMNIEQADEAPPAIDVNQLSQADKLHESSPILSEEIQTHKASNDEVISPKKMDELSISQESDLITEDVKEKVSNNQTATEITPKIDESTTVDKTNHESNSDLLNIKDAPGQVSEELNTEYKVDSVPDDSKGSIVLELSIVQVCEDFDSKDSFKSPGEEEVLVENKSLIKTAASEKTTESITPEVVPEDETMQVPSDSTEVINEASKVTQNEAIVAEKTCDSLTSQKPDESDEKSNQLTLSTNSQNLDVQSGEISINDENILDVPKSEESLTTSDDIEGEVSEVVVVPESSNSQKSGLNTINEQAQAELKDGEISSNTESVKTEDAIKELLPTSDDVKGEVSEVDVVPESSNSQKSELNTINEQAQAELTDGKKSSNTESVKTEDAIKELLTTSDDVKGEVSEVDVVPESSNSDKSELNTINEQAQAELTDGEKSSNTESVKTEDAIKESLNTSDDVKGEVSAVDVVPESSNSQKSELNTINEQAQAEQEDVEKSPKTEPVKTEDTIEFVPDSNDTHVETVEIQNQEISVIESTPSDLIADKSQISTENSECISETVPKTQHEEELIATNAINEQAKSELEYIEKSSNTELVNTEDTIEPVSESNDTHIETEKIQNQEISVIESTPSDLIADKPQISTINPECISETVPKTQNEEASIATDTLLENFKSQDIISSDEKVESLHTILDTDTKDVVSKPGEETAETQKVAEAIKLVETADELETQNCFTKKVETATQIPLSECKDAPVISEEEQTIIEEKTDNTVGEQKAEESVSKEQLHISPVEKPEKVAENTQIEGDFVHKNIFTELTITEDTTASLKEESNNSKEENKEVLEQIIQDEIVRTEAVKEENDSSDGDKIAEEMTIVSISQDSVSASKDSPEVAEEVQAASLARELIAETSQSSDTLLAEDTSEFKTSVQSESENKSLGEASIAQEVSKIEALQQELNEISAETVTAEKTKSAQDIDGAQIFSEPIAATKTPEPKIVDKSDEEKKPTDASEKQTTKRDCSGVTMAEDKLSEVMNEQVFDVEMPPIEVLTATCKTITHPPLQPTESLIESAQFLYEEISHPISETTLDINAPTLAEELRMATDRYDSKESSTSERVIPQSIACESRCFTPDPQSTNKLIASDSIATDQQPNAQDAAQGNHISQVAKQLLFAAQSSRKPKVKNSGSKFRNLTLRDRRFLAELEKRRKQRELIQNYLDSLDCIDTPSYLNEDLYLFESKCSIERSPYSLFIEPPEYCILGATSTSSTVNTHFLKTNILFSDRISSESNCTDDSTTTVIDTFGSMESRSSSDSGEEFSPDDSTDRDSSATATTANNSIITTNKATNQSHIYSPKPPLPPQPQPELRTESACSKLHETRTTGGNAEHVDDDPLKHLVPGSIAEREYKKWYNAVDMPNNPYSVEALRRRLSGGLDRALDLPNISPCNEENPLQLCESPATEAENKEQDRDYSRYSRDYYINDAKQASGTTKKSPTSPPQISSPTSTTSSIELIERVENNARTIETTPVREMCHKLEKQCRIEANIYLATPVQVIEDIPQAFADKNPVQGVGTITSLTTEAVSKLSSETSSNLTNESLTPSEDSDTIRIYDLKKQETRLVKESTQTTTTTITVPKSPEKKVRPTELEIMPTLAPPIATVSSKGSTPTSFKFLQPKRKLINPSQVLSIDLDTTPITPATPEKPVIEAEVVHAMPSVKALAKAFLMTSSTSSSENRWRKARAKSPLQFFKPTTPTSATAATNFTKVLQKQPEPVDTTSQGSEDATIASDLSSLETDPPSKIDVDTIDSNASEDRALSPVVLSGCLRNNIAFFENLKNK